MFIFFRDSKEYMALSGSSFNCRKLAQAEKLIKTFGLKNIDIISRVSRASRDVSGGQGDGEAENGGKADG